jgi:hypothetical protein
MKIFSEFLIFGANTQLVKADIVANTGCIYENAVGGDLNAKTKENGSLDSGYAQGRANVLQGRPE